MTIRRLDKLIGNLQHPSAFEEIEPHFLSRRYHLRKGEKENGWHLCLLGLSLRFSVRVILYPYLDQHDNSR